jgi:hypothetical protein
MNVSLVIALWSDRVHAIDKDREDCSFIRRLEARGGSA